MDSGTHFGSMVLGTMTFGDTVDLDGRGLCSTSRSTPA